MPSKATISRRLSKPRNGLGRFQHDYQRRSYAAAATEIALCKVILNEVPNLGDDLKSTLQAILARAEARQSRALRWLKGPPELRSNGALRDRAEQARRQAEWAGKGN